MQRQNLIASLVVLSVSMGVTAHAQEKKTTDEKITYDDHIMEIFRVNCFKCHNVNDKNGDLDLTSYTGLMTGGGSGAVMEPGSASDSYLYKLISRESEPYMPPEGDKLPDATLAMIRKWIDGGGLENKSSKVKIKKKKFDFALTGAPTGKPEVPPLPDVLNLEPVLRTKATTAISAVATSPWAPVVAVAGQQQIILYDSQTLQTSGVLPFPEGVAHVLKFSRNGQLLLAGGGRGSYKGLAVVWDIRSGERVFEIGDELDAVLAADISADHTMVALGGPNKVVRVYTTQDGELAYELTKHTEWIYALEFSPDGVLLATADRNGGMFVWEAFTGREYLTLKGHGGAITGVSWRIDSNILASSSEDSTIRLWEMNNGGQVKNWGAHGGGAASVEFTRDGRVVSCGRDKVTKLWDQNGTQLLAFEAFPDLALRATHCDETNRVIAGDWTGAIRAWSAADGKRVGELTTNPPMLASRLALAEAALPPATEAQTKARAALEQVTARHKAEIDKLTAAQTTMTAAQQTIVALQKDKTVQEPALNEARAKQDQQQKELAALQAALPSLKTAAESAKAAVEALPADEPLAQAATKIAEVLKTRTESAATRQTELDTTQKGVTSSDAVLKELIAKLQQNEQAATTADAAVKASTAALEPLNKGLEESQQAVAAADGLVQTITAETERWKQYIALRDELKALEQQRTAKDDRQLAMLKAESALAGHKQKVGASQQVIQTHQQTVAAQQKMMDELQTRIAATKLQEKQQRDQATKHNQAIPSLETALQQAQSAIALLPDDAAIKASVDSLTAAVAAKKESLAAIELAVVKSQESLKADEAAVATAIQAIKTAQEQAAAEQQNLATLQTAEAPLITAVKSSTTEFQAVEARHQQAAKVVEVRRSQLRPATVVTQNN